jgi:hypothetical protein
VQDQRKIEDDMAPAWLPDWRNQSQYPNPTTTTGVEWAWQFLRRNPAYQRQYATLRRKMGAGLTMPAGVAKDFIEQFGIATLPPPDPAQPSPTLSFCSVHSIQKPSNWPAGREFAFSTVLDYDQVLVWFDLNWPINHQLISAKKLLNEAAPPRKPLPRSA